MTETQQTVARVRHYRPVWSANPLRGRQLGIPLASYFVLTHTEGIFV